MNIDDLTIGQARELASLFGKTSGGKPPHPFIGKYCVARCYAAGVHAGTVESVDGQNVILKDSRRLWSWTASDGIALSGVAQHGIKTGNVDKVDVVNPLIYLSDVCELIPTTEKAKESIHGFEK